MKSSSVLMQAALVVAALATTSAQADQFKSLHASGMCLSNTGGRAVLAICSSAPSIQFSGYGEVKTNGQCLAGPGNGQLLWTGCNNSPAQRWTFRGQEFINEGGWCADITRELKGIGAQIGGSQCGSGMKPPQKKSNQMWAQAATAPAAPTIALANHKTTLDDVNNQIRINGGNLKLGNAVQLVASGAGNFTMGQVLGLVASGAGNYSGGGHLISQDGASFKVMPNGSLVGNSGGTYVIQGNSLVASGAGNLVASGAGNLVASGAGNLVASGAGNLVASGAGNAAPRYTVATASGPKCDNLQLTAALKDQKVLAALQKAGKAITAADNGSSGLCNPNRYRAGSGWANQGDVNDLVQQSVLCNDPWIGEIYAEGLPGIGYSKPRRSGASDECNPNNYGGGSWSNFADLRTKIQAYKRTHP